MPSDAHDPEPTPSDEPPSVRLAARGPLSGVGEFFAFLRAALIAVRDLWVAEPPEPPVTKGEDHDAP